MFIFPKTNMTNQIVNGKSVFFKKKKLMQKYILLLLYDIIYSTDRIFGVGGYKFYDQKPF